MRTLPTLTVSLDLRRDARGLTDAEILRRLAKKGLRVHFSTYSQYRAGTRLMPVCVLEALCNILEVPREERLWMFERLAAQDKARRLSRDASAELMTA